MDFSLNEPIKLFDQVDGYGDIHNVLGFGDPHVVKISITPSEQTARLRSNSHSLPCVVSYYECCLSLAISNVNLMVPYC